MSRRCDQSCEQRHYRRYRCIRDYLSALGRVNFTQLFSLGSVTKAQTGGVACTAHVEGAVFRTLTVRFFEDRERLAAQLEGSLLTLQ